MSITKTKPLFISIWLNEIIKENNKKNIKCFDFNLRKTVNSKMSI